MHVRGSPGSLPGEPKGDAIRGNVTAFVRFLEASTVEPSTRRALRLEPANARFYYHLGALLVRDNRAEEAQAAFEQAMRLKPDYAPPHYQAGKILLLAGKPEPAVREFETAIRHDPELAQAYYQLSRAYALLGEKEKSAGALAAFNRLKKQETDEDRELLEGIRKEIDAP